MRCGAWPARSSSPAAPISTPRPWRLPVGWTSPMSKPAPRGTHSFRKSSLRSGGGKGPWGSGPHQPSGGGTPPDLEELLRRSQDKLRKVLPGNLGGKGLSLILLGAVVIWGFSGFFRVDPDERGVVLRFGRYD